eukprot:4099193-Pyramimonas_sp.AAC.1
MNMLDGSAWAVQRCAAGSNCWRFPAMQVRHLRKSWSVRDHTLSMGSGLLPYLLISSAVATWTAPRVKNESCSAWAARIHES